MKILTLLATISLSAVCSAQTLPLSQSSTFQTKANLASPNFTGTVSFATDKTSAFYAAYSSMPYLNFASGSLIQFTPNVSEFDFYINSTQKLPPLALNPNSANFATPQIRVLGTAANEGAVQLETSHDQTHTGYASFFLPGSNGARIGYVGYGTSAGNMTLASDTGSINISPAGAPNPMIVGKDANGKLQIIINNLPTTCTGEPTGTLYVNGGAVRSC